MSDKLMPMLWFGRAPEPQVIESLTSDPLVAEGWREQGWRVTPWLAKEIVAALYPIHTNADTMQLFMQLRQEIGWLPSSENYLRLSGTVDKIIAAWNSRPSSSILAGVPEGMMLVPVALLKKLKPIVGGVVASPNNTARPMRQKVYDELCAVISNAADKVGV